MTHFTERSNARDTSDGKVDFLKEAMKIAGASGKCILYSY